MRLQAVRQSDACRTACSPCVALAVGPAQRSAFGRPGIEKSTTVAQRPRLPSANRPREPELSRMRHSLQVACDRPGRDALLP